MNRSQEPLCHATFAAVFNENTSENYTLINVAGLVAFVYNINSKWSSGKLEQANVKSATTSVVVAALGNLLQGSVALRIVDSDSAEKMQ